MERVRGAILARHYSRRTEESYAGWIRRFIFFHGKRHPAAMGAEKVDAFLTHLAVAGRVSASNVLLEMRGRGMRSPLGRLEEIGHRGD